MIKACDRLGMVVILGLFYGKQSGTFKDEAAVKAAVTNTVDWLLAAERDQRADRDRQRGRPRERLGAFDHRRRALPRTDRAGAEARQRQPPGQHQPDRDRRAAGRDRRHRRLPAAARQPRPWPDSHFQPSPHGIRLQLARWRASPAYRGQPIVYNEDDHFEFDKPDNHFVAAVEGGASWGYFDYRMSRERFEDGFQSLPVDWTISSKRKRAFFGLLKEITGA